jgi:hypothetical protein
VRLDRLHQLAGDENVDGVLVDPDVRALPTAAGAQADRSRPRKLKSLECRRTRKDESEGSQRCSRTAAPAAWSSVSDLVGVSIPRRGVPRPGQGQ